MSNADENCLVPPKETTNTCFKLGRNFGTFLLEIDKKKSFGGGWGGGRGFFPKQVGTGLNSAENNFDTKFATATMTNFLLFRWFGTFLSEIETMHFSNSGKRLRIGQKLKKNP